MNPVTLLTGAAGGQLVLDGPGSQLRTPTQPELAQNLADVRRCGALSDRQLLGDLAVREAARQKCHDFLFASGEAIGRGQRWEGGLTSC